VALRFAYKGCFYDLPFLFGKPIELINLLVYLSIGALDSMRKLFTFTKDVLRIRARRLF